MFSRKKALGVYWAILFAWIVTPVSLPLLKIGDPVLAEESQPEDASKNRFALPDTVAEGTTIQIDGSSSMATVNLALRKQFEAQYPGTQVKVQYRGTKAALQALHEGKVGLVAMGRPLTEEERAEGLGYLALPRQKVAIVVGAENPFKGSLTDWQFAKIFRGEITDWSEVGGEPGPIRFVDHAEGSDSRTAFLIYPVFQAAKFATGATSKAVDRESTAAVIEALGRDGISYAIADQAIDRSDLRIVLMHNTPVDDAKYPFSQPRYYVYKKEPNPAIRSFLGFVDAPIGQDTVANAPPSQSEAIAAGSNTSSLSDADSDSEPDANANSDANSDPALAEGSETDAEAGNEAGNEAETDAGNEAETEAETDAGAETDSDAPTQISQWDGLDTASKRPSSLVPPWVWFLGILLFFIGLNGWCKKRRAESFAEPGTAGTGAKPDGTGTAPAAGSTVPESESGGAESAAAAPSTAPSTNENASLAAGAIAAGSVAAATAAMANRPSEAESAAAEPSSETDRPEFTESIAPSPSPEVAGSNGAQAPATPSPTTPSLATGESPPAGAGSPLPGALGGALGAGAIAAGIAAGAALNKPSEADNTDSPGSEVTPATAAAAGTGLYRRMTVNSQTDCYVLNEDQMAALQSTANSYKLDPGLYVIRIRAGLFNYWSNNPLFPGEPLVLLWIHGGRFINHKTNVEAESTWSSLNSYDDTLTLQVLETTTLCGLFFDTHKDDNSGQIVLSILKDE